jgi:hypothetical protein
LVLDPNGCQDVAAASDEAEDLEISWERVVSRGNRTPKQSRSTQE